MLILRLILLFIFGLLVRRLYLAVKAVGTGGYPSPDHKKSGRKNDPGKTKPVDDLTEQDISDADFEEIP